MIGRRSQTGLLVRATIAILLSHLIPRKMVAMLHLLRSGVSTNLHPQATVLVAVVFPPVLPQIFPPLASMQASRAPCKALQGQVPQLGPRERDSLKVQQTAMDPRMDIRITSTFSTIPSHFTLNGTLLATEVVTECFVNGSESFLWIWGHIFHILYLCLQYELGTNTSNLECVTVLR